MTTTTAPQTLEAPAALSNPFGGAITNARVWRSGTVAGLAWAAFGLLTWRWPTM